MRHNHTWREHRVGRLALLLALAVSTDIARASAPPDQYILSPTTVIDRRTGLTWQRNPPATAVGWAAANGTTGTTPTPGLCAATLGVGWRLPTVREIETLVDVTTGWPALDTTAFPGTQSAGYWTSSCYAGQSGGCGTGTPAQVWILNFGLGQPTAVSTAATQEFYRCVRPG